MDRTSVFLKIAVGILAALPLFGESPKLYLLAATPTNASPLTYPARLYTLAPDGAPRLVREIVGADAGVDFVLPASDALVIGSPHIKPATVDVIHFDSPPTPDTLHFDIGRDASLLTAQIARPAGGSPMLLLGAFGDSSSRLIGVHLTRNVTPRVNLNVSSTLLSSIWKEGKGGSFDEQLRSVSASVTSSGLRIWFGDFVQIASASSQQYGGFSGNPEVDLCAASESYLVFVPLAERNGASELHARIYDVARRTQWQLDVAGSQSRFRLFGSWLSIRTVDKGTPGAAVAGVKQMRSAGTAERPPVRELYEDETSEFVFPGRLELVNLETKRRIEWNTGAADSEIVLVANGTVYYRVNDSLFQADISEGKMGTSVLVVQGDDVPEIHWAFFGSR